MDFAQGKKAAIMEKTGASALFKKGRLGMERCSWCMGNELLMEYHDREWGVPLHNDQGQFEFLMMEVMQCGLNWNMVLQKRQVFRQCFDQFDYHKIAAYAPADAERILQTPGMIRSPRKVQAVIHNAQCFLQVQSEFGSFSEYLWEFCGGSPILYAGHQKGRLPAQNGLSQRLSADLKRRGFKYLGPVTVYSHLQACGVINDHAEHCFCYQALLARYPVCRKRRDREA